MKDPEKRKAPCVNCRRELKERFEKNPDGMIWRACCGTWVIDGYGKIGRPAVRLS